MGETNSNYDYKVYSFEEQTIQTQPEISQGTNQTNITTQVTNIYNTYNYYTTPTQEEPRSITGNAIAISSDPLSIAFIAVIIILLILVFFLYRKKKK